MKWVWTIATAVLSLISSSTAFGLSCARPNLDEITIKSAIAIFEGTAGPKRSLDFRERAAVKAHAIKGIGGTTEDLRVYRFAVTRGWKGTAAGQSIDVVFNSYWGDGFAEGEAYLVVSPRRAGNLFWSPLCGHTIDVKHAAMIGELDLLGTVIGIGHHVKVRIADRSCRSAEDCTLVQTHCGACSCGTPVATAAVKRHELQFESLCATIRVAERCKMDCPPIAPSCAAGTCVAPE